MPAGARLALGTRPRIRDLCPPHCELGAVHSVFCGAHASAPAGHTPRVEPRGSSNRSFLPSTGEGIQCHGANRHFLCREHFNEHVRTEATTEALDMLATRKGRVFCPGCPQSATGGAGSVVFSDTEVAQHCESAVFGVFMAGKEKLLEQRLASQIEADAKARLEAELKKLRDMTEEQREVDLARR